VDLDALSTVALEVSQLNEQVYDVLRKEILKGNLRPGQRLSIKALAGHLGVSATPVRDAVRRLEGDGLVDIIPRRGTVVSEFKRSNVRQAFQIRHIIESAAAERATEASEDDIQHMQEMVDEISLLRENERFREYTRYIDLDAEFHRCIVGLLENQRISTFYERLRWPIQVIRGLSYSEYQRARQTVAEHAAIARAFQEKDASKARAAIRDHLNNAEADLLRRMPAESQP
jgi:DNA-binding GntR family transcriptional regulator